MVEIKHRVTGAVLCTGETIRAAVEANLKKLRDADLGDANLRDANLGGANLRDAYLRDAYLRGVHLGCADLRDADLGCAYLRGANLHGANLRGANLHGADLRGAYLRGADLGDVHLRDADLGDADLRGVHLGCANLRDANLRDADLRGVHLHGANGESRAKLAWQSHDLIAEILRRAAGDDVAKLKVAGYILMCRDKCWGDFLKLRDPLMGWALDVLRPWAKGDENAPEILRRELFESENPATE